MQTFADYSINIIMLAVQCYCVVNEFEEGGLHHIMNEFHSFADIMVRSKFTSVCNVAIFLLW